MNSFELVRVLDHHLPYCLEVDLFYEIDPNHYVLYKPVGKTISDIRLLSGKHPALFLRKDDQKKILIDAQKDYSKTLEKEIRNGDITKVRDILVRIVEDTLAEPPRQSHEN